MNIKLTPQTEANMLSQLGSAKELKEGDIKSMAILGQKTEENKYGERLTPIMIEYTGEVVKINNDLQWKITVTNAHPNR